MIPPIYNWHPCRVCGYPVPAGQPAHRECEEAQPARCACGNELLTDYEREIGMCAFCDHAADFYGCRDGAGEGGAGR